MTNQDWTEKEVILLLALNGQDGYSAIALAHNSSLKELREEIERLNGIVESYREVYSARSPEIL